MILVKTPIKIALLAALAIEVVNFRFFAPPLDVGFPPGTPWFVNLNWFRVGDPASAGFVVA